jgi:hypothetical protein
MAKKEKQRTRARKHTQIENSSIAGAKARLAPLGLILYAEHYLHAAKTAQPWPEGGELYHPARLFLVCRSLELALKAFLSLKGRSLDELSGGAFAHDLDNLLIEADKQGLSTLVELSEDQRWQIGQSTTPKRSMNIRPCWKRSRRTPRKRTCNG